jgi:hypothetical protein
MLYAYFLISKNGLLSILIFYLALYRESFAIKRKIFVSLKHFKKFLKTKKIHFKELDLKSFFILILS